jgi:hypothetical protein
MVEHRFLLRTLECFGFGNKCIDIINILYTDINSSVSLPFGTSKRFDIKRGIRQGCPTSPLLFIIVTELLAIHVKNNLNIQPLNVMGNSLVISQLADDTTLFLKNARQIPVALQEISLFSKASGLKLNMEKCEIVTIQDHDMINMYNIPVKNEVRYLGIIISKDKKVRETSNIENIIQKKIELFLTVGFKETYLFLDAFYLLKCKVCQDLPTQPTHWIYPTN